MTKFYLDKTRHLHDQILAILFLQVSFSSIGCILFRIVYHNFGILKDNILSLCKQFYFIAFSFHLKFISNDHDFEPKDTHFFVIKISAILLCLIFYLRSHDLSLSENPY